MSSDRLTGLDASFLHLERDGAHMHVASTMIFEGPPPAYDEFRAHLESRLHLVPHLQAVLQQPAGDAEGQGHLVLGLDATSKDDGQAGGALVDRQGANGTGVLGDLLRFLAAPRQQGCGQG